MRYLFLIFLIGCSSGNNSDLVKKFYDMTKLQQKMTILDIKSKHTKTGAFGSDSYYTYYIYVEPTSLDSLINEINLSQDVFKKPITLEDFIHLDEKDIKHYWEGNDSTYHYLTKHQSSSLKCSYNISIFLQKHYIEMTENCNRYSN